MLRPKVKGVRQQGARIRLTGAQPGGTHEGGQSWTRGKSDGLRRPRAWRNLTTGLLFATLVGCVPCDESGKFTELITFSPNQGWFSLKGEGVLDATPERPLNRTNLDADTWFLLDSSGERVEAERTAHYFGHLGCLWFFDLRAGTLLPGDYKMVLLVDGLWALSPELQAEVTSFQDEPAIVREFSVGGAE